MGTRPKRHTRGNASDEPPVVYTDDGGSGLLAACVSRFSAQHYEVSCDARHTVWVRSRVSSRSLGLSPWLLRSRSIEEILERTASKLEER